MRHNFTMHKKAGSGVLVLLVLVPMLSVVGLEFISMAPGTVLSGLAPILGMCGIFYWALYAPNLLPMLLVFLLGALQDMIWGQTLGLNAVGFVLLYQAVQSQHHFLSDRSFGLVWAGFILLSGLITFGQGMLVALFQPVDFHLLGMTMLVSVLLFPVVYGLLAMLHEKTIPAELV